MTAVMNISHKFQKFTSEIKQANWVTLLEDLNLNEATMTDDDRFDAIICLGNSFPGLTFEDSALTPQKKALNNFNSLLRPGGVLLIDHRNYDNILETGTFCEKNNYLFMVSSF